MSGQAGPIFLMILGTVLTVVRYWRFALLIAAAALITVVVLGVMEMLAMVQGSA